MARGIYNRSPDGLYHTCQQGDKAEPERYKKRKEKQNEDAKICGSCTRKKCRGTRECMEKRRREMQKAGEIPCEENGTGSGT